MMDILLPRHDGHEQKAKGYYKANDDIVKYGFWALVVLVLFCFSAKRCYDAIYRQLDVSGYSKVNFTSTPELSQQDARGSSESPIQGTPLKLWAIFRSLSYRRFSSSYRWLQYIEPPSAGQLLFLCCYWVVILAGLWTNVIFESPSELYGIQWEVVGFRGAWISTTQLPLLYATGCKVNIISLVTGITHERLNWFHQWIARTVFMTLIVHWAFFYREWDITGFVKQEIQMMPMVLWGFAAWGAIGLMVISGFGWFRDQAFELWLISHILLAWAVLALSYTHTRCTTYFVYSCVAILLFDLIGRGTLAVLHNNAGNFLFGGRIAFGHSATLSRLDNYYLRLTIDNPGFVWKAGQHVYVTIPKVARAQSHPFTIIGVSDDAEAISRLSLIIKAHAGATRDLHRLASDAPHRNTRVLLNGPYGNPPSLHEKEAIIFISTGNRASFTISLLQALSHCAPSGVKIVFHWIVPDTQMLSWYLEQLEEAARASLVAGANLKVFIHLTQGKNTDIDVPPRFQLTIEDYDAFSVGRDSMESESEISLDRKLISDQSPSKPGVPIIAASSSQSLEDGARTEVSDVEKCGESDGEIGLLRHSDSIEHISLDFDAYDTVSGKSEALSMSMSRGRPLADTLIRPTITASSRMQKVMVVAAVPSLLAADVSRSVGTLIHEGLHTGTSSTDIELWIEDNGR